MDILNFNEEEKQSEERNITWQKNDLVITNAINTLMRKNERLPTQIEIAAETGLDRKTVYQHLKQFKMARTLFEDVEKLEMVGSKILGRLGMRAMDGDMKAVKLWMFVMGFMDKKKRLE